MNKYVRATAIALSMCMSGVFLEGCLVGEGCAMMVDDSYLFPDQEWIKGNLNKEAFEFKCEADVFPPITIDLIVNFTVSDIYSMFTGNLAQVRANALAKAVNAIRQRIKFQNPAADIVNITCKETFMERPPSKVGTGSCKVSENDTGGDISVPPVLNPSPPPTSGFLPMPAPSENFDDID